MEKPIFSIEFSFPDASNKIGTSNPCDLNFFYCSLANLVQLIVWSMPAAFLKGDKVDSFRLKFSFPSLCFSSILYFTMLVSPSSIIICTLYICLYEQYILERSMGSTTLRIYIEIYPQLSIEID